VFGGDRVRGTWEQMMLQVDLVRHRVRVGRSFLDFYYDCLLVLNKFVNLYFVRFGVVIDFYNFCIFCFL